MLSPAEAPKNSRRSAPLAPERTSTRPALAPETSEPGAASRRSERPSPSRSPALATDEPTVVLQLDPHANAAPGPSWEEEVMALLVDAVEHALPEADQVPWLDELTARLNEGDVCEALAEAQVLIAHSDRPTNERLRMAARLAALFAPADDAP